MLPTILFRVGPQAHTSRGPNASRGPVRLGASARRGHRSPASREHKKGAVPPKPATSAAQPWPSCRQPLPPPANTTPRPSRRPPPHGRAPGGEPCASRQPAAAAAPPPRRCRPIPPRSAGGGGTRAWSLGPLALSRSPFWGFIWRLDRFFLVLCLAECSGPWCI